MLDLGALWMRVKVDKADAERDLNEFGKTSEKVEGGFSKFKQAAMGVASGIAAIGGAAISAVSALLRVDEATREYRENMAKLDTSFQSTGKSADDARTAYTNLYAILGDEDQATEATQLLSNIVQGEQDIAIWSDIAAGVVGRFGDSLPIESLIESANETANVGEVTGTLADALNWAGISEDDFNEKLAQCNSTQERNTLITETLSGTYLEAAEAYKKNNEQTMTLRENQVRLKDSTARLGDAVSDLKTKFTIDLIPGLGAVIDSFVDVLNGLDGADEQFANDVEALVAAAVEKLPDFIDLGIDILWALIEGMIAALPEVIAALPEIILSLIDKIISLIPEFIEAGAKLIWGLFEGVWRTFMTVVDWIVEKLKWLAGLFGFEFDDDEARSSGGFGGGGRGGGFGGGSGGFGGSGSRPSISYGGGISSAGALASSYGYETETYTKGPTTYTSERYVGDQAAPNVNINFTGNLSQLARALKPEIEIESARSGSTARR